MPVLAVRTNPLLAYDVWRSMHKRCSDPGTNNYYRYGGRGIQVCERWRSYEAFIEDMGPRPHPKHQLDRIDSDGHYTKENCRWVTPAENIRNSCTTKFIEWNGERKTQQDWAESLGVSPSAFSERLRKWPLERVMITPVGPTGPKRKNIV